MPLAPHWESIFAADETIGDGLVDFTADEIVASVADDPSAPLLLATGITELFYNHELARGYALQAAAAAKYPSYHWDMLRSNAELGRDLVNAGHMTSSHVHEVVGTATRSGFGGDVTRAQR